MGEFQLYSYFRSSASYRVRIALNLKGLSYDYIPVHLVKDGGEQKSLNYTQKNPMAQVPTFIHNGHLITQSMAIIQYLDDIKPTPRLFPTDHIHKALVIELCEMINSGIQPMQNLSVIHGLKTMFQVSDEQTQQWVRHWIAKGLTAFEKRLEATAGSFCVGGMVTAVETFLVPQVFACLRFGVDPTNFPKIYKIYSECEKIEAFKRAHPKSQPDFEA